MNMGVTVFKRLGLRLCYSMPVYCLCIFKGKIQLSTDYNSTLLFLKLGNYLKDGYSSIE